MDNINSLVSFITTNQVKVSHKLGLFISVVVFIFFIDNLVGFSHNWQVDKKISQLKELNKILSDTSCDKDVHNYAVALKQEVMHRKNVVENSYNYLASIKWKTRNPTIKKPINSQVKNTHKPPIKTPIKEPTEKPIEVTKYPKTDFWFHMSSSLGFYLFGIFVLVVLMVSKGIPLGRRILSAIGTTAVCFAVGFFFYFICSLIPIMFEMVWLNYVINILIQGSVFGLIFYLAINEKI